MITIRLFRILLSLIVMSSKIDGVVWVSKDSEDFKIFSAYETCQRYLEYGTGEVGESEEVTAFSVWVARTGKDKIRLIESGQDEVDLVKCR